MTHDATDRGHRAAGSQEALPAVYRVFSYVTAERADFYVAVVDVLLDAKDRFRLQVRPVEVVRDLALVGRERSASEVRDALERLADWGNLTRFYDSASPETLAEFYGKRFLYQLTSEGVAAHQGVQAARRAGLDSGGRLSAVMLPGVVERLEAVRAESVDPDPARLYALLIDLFAAFAELADNAGRYMSDLSVEITEIVDDDRFVAYKRAVFAYLNAFVARFTELVPGIAALVAELDPAMPELLALAAAEDVAPSAAGEDAGPLDGLLRRWSGLREWFCADADRAPVAEALRVAMLDALNRILIAVTRLNDRHLRRASREADFDALARWFAPLEPEAAHKLWDAAFSTFGARHFDEPAGDEDVERRRSFWEAEPAEVAPRLRAAGVRASPGRPGHVSDYSAAKAARVQAMRAARARAQAAAERLARRTPARLSELGELDGDEFTQLLGLMGAALTARPGRDGTRRAHTPFGQVTVRRETPGARATVRTPGGAWHAPDLGVDIAVAARARSEEATG